MIKGKVSIKKDTDPGFKKLSASFGGGNGKTFVTVGIHEDAGSYQSGVSVVDVALWQEFGTERLPARSFIRAALTQHEALINEWRTNLVNEVLEKKLTPERALEKLGFNVAQMIESFITGRHVEPADAGATIAAKKREGTAPPDTVLYETGLLMRSIGYRVVEDGDAKGVKYPFKGAT